MRLQIRSLQAKLAVRLAVVILLATLLGVGALVFKGYNAADTLGNEELLARARELSQYVVPDSTGAARLDLPPQLERVYRPSAETDLFIVQDNAGHMIAAAPRELAAAMAGPTGEEITPHYFRLEQFGPNQEDYYGLRVRVDSAAGPLLVTVARASDADALAYALLRAFVVEIAWVIPIFAAATLVIGVWSIRQGLRPVLAASRRAGDISPDAIAVRLPDENVPSEILPLVAAVNQALDRLEEGFAIQRQFTANAAHELRTPLAILTAGLDNLEDGDDLERLRSDAARMNRLVEQLLLVARLDAMPSEIVNALNLGRTIADVVAYLAPWAVAQGRTLGLDWSGNVVRVCGNADAIADAVRNLIENAVYHAPMGTEVAISVLEDGTVSVADKGPGVPVGDRKQVFERFWRGRGERGPGAGLGLAIVAEISKAHSARIEISDVPGGGAMFTIRFPVV